MPQKSTKSYAKQIILFFILSLILAIAIALTISPQTDQKTYDPVSQKNDFLNHLNRSLQIAQINPVKMDYRDFQQEVEFYIINHDSNDQVKVILSTKKDPYWQIGQVKKILSLHRVKLIDLSLNHPYATLKNN